MKMNSMRLFVMSTVIVAALSGCATAYQSKGFSGGFSETMLSPDSFKINFAGNGYTSAERSSDFAMLRAADKSLELGCNYFGILNEADGASVGSVTVGSAGWGRGGAWGFSSTVPVVKPNSTLLVKCFKTRPLGGNTFDANFITQSIRTKYGIKSASLVAPTATAAPAQRGTLEIPVATPAAQPNMESDSSIAPSPPTSDVASMVLAAQRASAQQGCGDVHSAGGSTFEAQCSTFTVIIDCNGDSCHPIRAIKK